MADRRPARERDDIVIRGARAHPLRDAYHALLRTSWPVALTLIAGGFVAANVLFALIYVATGGIAHAHEGSFADAFFFSVQTMGTIGYGAMYPESPAANVVVVVEAVFGMVYTALATGLVFAKFSQSSGHIVFSDKVVIGPMNGVRTLAFRIGNDRASTIAEAAIRVSLTRTERLAEGGVFYRMIDLPLVRERSPALSRSWTVMHVVDERSPFHGMDPASIAREEFELTVTVVGTDDISLQPVHARCTYPDHDIVFDARLVDVLSIDGEQRIVLDLARFHDIEQLPPPASAGPSDLNAG